MRPRVLTAGAGAVLVALGLVLSLTVWPPPGFGAVATTGLLAAAWVLFGLGAWLVRRVPRRAALLLILLGGTALPMMVATAPPQTSDDVYRYAWDGRVQSAGVDPYRYAPAAPELVPLRDSVLWSEDATWCVAPGAADQQTGENLAAGCTHINRPGVHTIYPPLAQVYFLVVHRLSPTGSGVWPLQLAAAFAAAAVTVLLLVGLPRLSIDPRQAVWWAWCPTVVLESGNNAHIDAVAAASVVGVLLTGAVANSRLRVALSGVLLALAVATKLTPALIGPALLRRRPLLLIGSSAAVLAVLYLPHVLAVGVDAAGYLPGYFQEEGYADGSRFALIGLLVPDMATTLVAVVVLVATAAVVVRTADPDRPWAGATLLTGTALLLTAPMYPWYAQLLVVLVAFSGRTEWLPVAAAGYVALHAQDLHLSYTGAQQIGYGAAALAVGVVMVVRMRRARGSGKLGGSEGDRETLAPDAHAAEL